MAFFGKDQKGMLLVSMRLKTNTTFKNVRISFVWDQDKGSITEYNKALRNYKKD